MSTPPPRVLTELTKEMRELAKGGDIEAVHAQADRLLIEVLLEVWDQDRFAMYEIEAVLEAYGDVPKWYA